MKQSDLFKILCKAFGLYFLIVAVINLKDFLIYLIEMGLIDQRSLMYQEGNVIYQPESLIIGVGNLLSVVLLGTIGLVLISYASSITGWAFKNRYSGEKDVKMEVNIDKTILIELVIIAFSASMIINSLPGFFNSLCTYVFFNPERDSIDYFSGRVRTQLFFNIFSIVIGFLVITNSRRITRKLVAIGDKADSLARGQEQGKTNIS